MGPKETAKKNAKMKIINTDVTPPKVSLASVRLVGGGRMRTKYARISMQIPHTAEPSLSQKRFPFILTKKNIKAIAERSFMSP